MQPLADTIMAACANPAKMVLSHPEPSERRKIGAALKAQMRNARRFFVDDEVTRAATVLGVQHPEILMSMLRRARLPFEKVWVEWDNHAQNAEAGRTEPDEDSPPRIGVLIERMDPQAPRYRMTVIGQVWDADDNRLTNNISVSPLSVVYDLDQPIASFPMSADQAKIAKIANLPNDFVSRTLLGSVYVGISSKDLDEEAVQHKRKLCDDLTDHAAYMLTPFMAPLVREMMAGSSRINGDNLRETLRREIIESAGTWRFVVSLFALINARDYVESERSFRQGKSRMVGGNVVPFLDHWMVSLKLPRKLVLPRVIREMTEAIPKRRHEVIGHWKHSRKKWPGLPGCEHVYASETPTREVCTAPGCGHKRWWVNEFHRGDARIGFISKDRVVEAAKRVPIVDHPTSLDDLGDIEIAELAYKLTGQRAQSPSEALDDAVLALDILGLDEADAIRQHRAGTLNVIFSQETDA